MFDDPVHDGMLREESDDLHSTAAIRTKHRIDLVDFPDHGRPGLGRDARELLFNNPKGKSGQAGFPDLPPVGVGVQAELC
jgi:hypothetical protein